mmetsp:Transcript_1394/g.1871  ORF Transcript_1394/g.1871 Transcript_1394/m.1871 type:complete len:273 (-) Transcript_1394:115-933(-)
MVSHIVVPRVASRQFLLRMARRSPVRSTSSTTVAVFSRLQQSRTPTAVVVSVHRQCLASFPTRYFSDTHTASATSADDKATEVGEEEEDKKTETVEANESSVDDVDEQQQQQNQQTEDLENEVKDLKDQLLRSLAEQENTRRIAKRDVDSARQFAIKSFAKSLLDTSDNLTRALQAVPEEMRSDKQNHAVLATLYEGIQMTDAGLNKAFQTNGLLKYGQIGDSFDPNIHDALFEYPDPNSQPGTIGQVMKTGFMLNDRVLRPAEVGVVKKTD